MDKVQTLAHYFGYQSFRAGQEELIDQILAGNDVLGIMPTGAGKSLCYQIPALMSEGITLVISPLISLMKDQVSALVQSGVSAAFINSTLSPRQSELALQRAEAGLYKIIYVAPERLTAPSFLHFARNADITMVVVDEAHCVSQWGQNFRPSYLQIASFVSSLPKRPVSAAFTATATDKVRRDIVELLGLRSPHVVTTGFDRPNLYFEVMKPKDKFAALTSYLALNRGKSGIIYCATRKLVEEVSDRLLEEGWRVGKYHAGLSDAARNTAQDLFIKDECPIMVATNAFGMGIDKSNVAFVVHYNMPKNMESYYQEAGRAGRDGEPAECILLYSGQDVRINTFLIEKSFEDNDAFDEETAETLKNNELELLKRMTFYSTGKDCYRRAMLRYFGEKPAFVNCGNCSNCTQAHSDFTSRDITVEAQKILSCVKRMGETQTKWVIIDILRGTDNNRVAMCGGSRQSTFGIMREESSRDIERMIDAMIGGQYLEEAPDGVLRWGSGARGVIYSGMRVTMKEHTDHSTAGMIDDERKIGRKADPELLGRLKRLRQKVASFNGVPPFVIFSDASLRDMAEKVPTNEAEFRSLYGVGRVKAEKFGYFFLDEIKAFRSERSGKKSSSEKADAVGEKADPELLERLRKLRKEIGQAEDLRLFMVFSNASLSDMAERMPLNEEQFLCIHGAGKAKAEKYGERFIKEIAAYCAEKHITPDAAAFRQRDSSAGSGEHRKNRMGVAANKPSVHLTKDAEGHYELPEGVDGDVFAALRSLRADLASDYGVQGQVLASTDALAEIARDCPVTLAALTAMGILPDGTLAYCGGEWVRTVRKCLENKGVTISEPCDCPAEPDKSLLAQLTQLRSDISGKIFTPCNRIISDASLRAMSELKPLTRLALRESIHLSDAKCLMFGRLFLEAIRRYVGDNQTPDGFEGAPEIDRALFIALAAVRHRFAVREGKTELSVMSDQTLYDICLKKPCNEEDFRMVYGIGEFKSKKYGDEVIACVTGYLRWTRQGGA